MAPRRSQRLSELPGHHRALERRRNDNHHGHVQQHAEHHVRTRLLHHVVVQRLGLRRGPLPSRDRLRSRRTPRATPASRLALPSPSGGAKYVSATATDPSGNTSEFSHDFGSDSPPTAVIGFTTLTVDEGVAIPFDASGSLDPQGSPLSYNWSFGDGGTATGVDPIHTYRSVGTFNVILTVNDGFGGISRATAAITVNDVPPAFVPRAFTPPVTFASPTPGDGFGASVASVAGNAAIGAPFDNGPSATDRPGAVFLYDGVPTDDGVSTTYAYSTIIHIFADPNPAAGDRFGAAIATVGTDLLVGALAARSPAGWGRVPVRRRSQQPDLRHSAGDL